MEQIDHQRSRCGHCGLVLESGAAFSAHIAGLWTPNPKDDDYGAHRRCLRTEELRSKGWTKKDGCWHMPSESTAVSASGDDHA